MKAAIDAGKIGRPVLGVFTMYSWRDEAYYRSDPWRGKWDTEGGGVLVNQSPHQLDLLQWFMGEIDEITGYWANLNHPDDRGRGHGRGRCCASRTAASASIVTSLSQKPGIYTKVHIHGSNGASVGVETDTRRHVRRGHDRASPSRRSTTCGPSPARKHCWPSFQAEDRPASSQSTPRRIITRCRSRISCKRS